jgi:hypothetical protein
MKQIDDDSIRCYKGIGCLTANTPDLIYATTCSTGTRAHMTSPEFGLSK